LRKNNHGGSAYPTTGGSCCEELGLHGARLYELVLGVDRSEVAPDPACFLKTAALRGSSLGPIPKPASEVRFLSGSFAGSASEYSRRA
jgi:hypothetical protein